MDANEVLTYLRTEFRNIFQDRLVGVYLFGSLTYGAFTPSRSDIDLVVVITSKVDNTEMKLIEDLYNSIEVNFPFWSKRIECSFVTIEMLASTLPPIEPRPYFGERFYKAAPYGNEWIINNYLIQEYGQTISGKEIADVFKRINFDDVKTAIIKDFHQEWLPKLNDMAYLNNPHYCSYLVLNLCRILYSLNTNGMSSKKTAANWVMQQYPQFEILINHALEWSYGDEFPFIETTQGLIKLVENVINTSSD